MKKTCPNCGKQFTPWRKKQFCSERCRKQSENRRLRGDKTPPGYPPSQKPENIAPTGSGEAVTAASIDSVAVLGEDTPERSLVWAAAELVSLRIIA